jgi:hypothetical protein
MKIDYQHPFTDDEARSRIEALGDYLSNRHNIKVEWLDGSRARFAGKYLVVKIDGELSIAPGVVRFRGEDPGMLWRKKASEYIEGKLAKYLDPKAPLASLPRQ